MQNGKIKQNGINEKTARNMPCGFLFLKSVVVFVLISVLFLIIFVLVVILVVVIILIFVLIVVLVVFVLVSVLFVHGYPPKVFKLFM